MDGLQSACPARLSRFCRTALETSELFLFLLRLRRPRVWADWLSWASRIILFGRIFTPPTLSFLPWKLSMTTRPTAAGMPGGWGVLNERTCPKRRHDARPREALRVNVTVPSSRWHLGSGEALRGLETHAALQAFLTCLSPVPAGSGKDFMLLFSSKSRIRHCSPFELIFCKMCWWYFRRHYSLLEIDAFNCLFSLLSARPSASLPLSFRSTSSFHVRLSSSFFGWISIALRVLIPQTRLLSLLLFLFSLVVLAVQTLPPQIAFLFPRGQKDICIFLLFPVAPSSVLNVQVGLNTFFWSLVDLLRIQNVRETCWNKHTQEILLL